MRKQISHSKKEYASRGEEEEKIKENREIWTREGRKNGENRKN